jgi:uncharacterized protein YndB with AHSA1/START domain
VTAVIETNAPVVARASVFINADPVDVWNVIAAIDDWPRWNPDVKRAELRGPLEPGVAFIWKSGPGTINSVLQVVEPPQAIGWTGSMMGIKAAHVWRITPQNPGTLLATEESWNGLLPRLMTAWAQRALSRAIDRGLLALKTAVERD